MNQPFQKYEGIKINGKWIKKSTLLNTHWNESKNDEAALAFAATLFNESDSISVQTSGSTGIPKQLTFSKSSAHQSAKATNDFFNLIAKDSAILALPMQYIAGKMMVARALVGGYNLEVHEPSSKPIEAGMKGKFMPLTPFQLANQIDELPQHEIEIFLIGGGAISHELQKKIAGAGIKAFASFGMTETLSHFALAEIGDNSPLKYTCLNGVSIKADTEGQLSLKWPGITDGWLKTNDLAEVIGNRFIWLGRSDYLINSGGIKVIPEQIESLLYSIVDGDYFIYALPHETLGQEVVLFTEGENDLTSLGEIIYPSPYHKPKRIIQIADFHRTASGKIKRKATIKAWLKNQN